MNGMQSAGELLGMVERRAADNLSRSDTYIGKDGVLRCSVCHEPRRAFIEAIGREMPVACSCSDREAAKRKRQERIAFVKQKAETCILYDASYNSFTFARDNSPDSVASKQCRAYVERWEDMERKNFGLILSGTLGTGKSYYAAAVVNALRARGVSALIVTTSRLVNALRASRDPLGVTDELNSFQLVALDDLGAERDTDFAVEQIENFVNDRILINRPLIVTTNLTGKELNAPPDMRYARIFDRILVMCPRPVILTGQSRRVDQRQERAAEMKSILGCDRGPDGTKKRPRRRA